MVSTPHNTTPDTHHTRRRFLNYVGWGSFAAFWGGSLIATLRFLFPRVLYEPSQQFEAGAPADYQVGEVSTRLKKEQRVWIIRNKEGMYALIAICRSNRTNVPKPS